MFLLVIQLVPRSAMAEVVKNDEQENSVILFSEEIDGHIEIYRDKEGANLTFLIEDDTIVELIEESNENDEYSYIQYISGLENDEVVESVQDGYVHNGHIVKNNEAGQYRMNRLDVETTETEKSELPDVEEEGVQANSDSKTPNLLEDDKEIENIVETERSKQTKWRAGLALKQNVSVYIDTSKEAKVLKSYNYGHLLKYHNY